MRQVWQLLDEQVAAGRMPGYVAAVRIGGRTEVHAGGRRGIEPDSPAMTEDTLFRIASVTKPLAGALTLSLCQDGVLSLDDPVDRWLPEVAGVRVLRSPDAELTDTVELRVPLTVRHLLTMTSGWGISMTMTPHRQAMLDLGVHPSAFPPQLSGDEFVAALARLPLAFQPGDGWLYDTGTNVLGVLLARAVGKSLSELLAERITRPLGLSDTDFRASDVDRMASAYRPDDDGLVLLDPPDGVFSRPPAFESLSGGLVSTAPDVLACYAALADGGGPILTADSVAMMTSDQLTAAQRAQAQLSFVDPGASWGLGAAVDLTAAQPWMAPGRWWWTGGSGTTASVDPARDVVAVLLTQRAMMGPDDGFEAFWTAVADAA